MLVDGHDDIIGHRGVDSLLSGSKQGDNRQTNTATGMNSILKLTLISNYIHRHYYYQQASQLDDTKKSCHNNASAIK